MSKARKKLMWWYLPIISATQDIGSGRSCEPNSSSSVWAMSQSSISYFKNVKVIMDGSQNHRQKKINKAVLTNGNLEAKIQKDT